MKFIKGAIFGAALALLFAPKSGKETRNGITKKFGEHKEMASDYADVAKAKSEEMQHSAGEATDNIKITLAKTAQGIKEQLKSASEDIKNETMSTEADMANTAKEAAQSASNNSGQSNQSKDSSNNNNSSNNSNN